MMSSSNNNSSRPSTTIKKWHDETTDTQWEICPFCKAYIKDLTYVSGSGLRRQGFDDPNIDSHIAAEHGVRRVRVGRKYRWISVSEKSLDLVKLREENRLKYWGEDSIRRPHD
jgi:hypothetical protein